MVSEVQLCNMAVGHLGRAGNIQAIRPPDGSVEADLCAQFYDQARDEVTERHTWPWATQRANLALLAVNPVTSWLYAYSLPNNILRMVAVYLPEEIDDTNTQLFAVEAAADGSAILYTNAALAVGKFVVSVADTSKFTPLFVSAVSWLLAHYIAGPITKSPDLVKSCIQIYEAQFGNAAASVANAAKKNTRETYTPPSLKARF
jgi:hypothetical protein